MFCCKPASAQAVQLLIFSLTAKFNTEACIILASACLYTVARKVCPPFFIVFNGLSLLFKCLDFMSQHRYVAKISRKYNFSMVTKIMKRSYLS